MQVRWWYGAFVIGLCAGSYALGRVQAGVQAFEQPSVACNDPLGRMTVAPEQSLAQQIPVATVEQKTEKKMASPAILPAVESVTAAQTVNRTIDNALNRRIWSEEDAQAFRHAAPEMSAEERDRLIHRLTAAINSGEVKVTVDRGPPF